MPSTGADEEMTSMTDHASILTLENLLIFITRATKGRVVLSRPSSRSVDRHRRLPPRKSNCCLTFNY